MPRCLTLEAIKEKQEWSETASADYHARLCVCTSWKQQNVIVNDGKKWSVSADVVSPSLDKQWNQKGTVYLRHKQKKNKTKKPMHQENYVLTTFCPDFYSQLIHMVQQRSTKDHYQKNKK